MTGVRHRLSAASCRTHVLVLLLLGIGSGLLPCTVDAVRPRRKSGGRGSKPSVSLSDTLEPDRSSANAERPSSSTLRMMMGGSLPSKRAQDVRMEQFEATALHETATQQLRQRCLEVRTPSVVLLPVRSQHPCNGPVSSRATTRPVQRSRRSLSRSPKFRTLNTKSVR